MTTNAYNIVTGTPFTITFNGGTNTFNIPGDYTAMFNPGAILTVLGGSPNGGYQAVTSSVFSGGNTVVTVSSYSAGTSYPGPATFTGSGAGNIIWFHGSDWTLQTVLSPLGYNWSMGAVTSSAGTTIVGRTGQFGTLDIWRATDGALNGSSSWTNVTTGALGTGGSMGWIIDKGSDWFFPTYPGFLDFSTDDGVTWGYTGAGMM